MLHVNSVGLHFVLGDICPESINLIDVGSLLENNSLVNTRTELTSAILSSVNAS